jgi:hypothetical protein
VPLREEIRSANSLLVIDRATRAAHRDSESCFCFRFVIMVDGVIPSSEPISTEHSIVRLFLEKIRTARAILCNICECYDLNGRPRAQSCIPHPMKD